MKPILLEELTSPGCKICKLFEEFWQSIEKDWPNVTYKNISLLSSEGQEMLQKHMILASPGILLNGELFSTGGFDKKMFISKLKELS